MVNAYLLHNKTEDKLQIASFRKDIITGLTNYRKADTGRDVNPERHLLVETEERTADNRKKDHAALDAMPVWPKKKGQASLEKEQNLFPQSVPNALQSHIIVWSIFKRNTKNEKLSS